MLVGQKSRLSFESLETRSLLSGMHAVEVHAGGTLDAHVPGIVSLHGGAHANSVTNLRASLSDPTGASDVMGQVHLQTKALHGTTSSSLAVNVRGATAGDTIDVALDGTSVGQITVGADGTGSLRLRSSSLIASAGSVVTLSQTTTDDTGADITTDLASGTLARVGRRLGLDDVTHEASRLVASATDATSGLSVRATSESETEDGNTENNLNVLVRGGTPGSMIDVSLGDDAGGSTSLGQVTVNNAGVGHLSLHDLSTAIASGNTLDLSTINADGTLTPLTSAVFSLV